MELSTFKRNWMLHYIKPEYLYLPGNENKPDGQLYIPYNGDFSLTGTKKWKKLIVDVQKNNYSIQPVFDRTPQWIKFDTWTAEDENFPYHIEFYYALDVYFTGSMTGTKRQLNYEVYQDYLDEKKFFHPSVKAIILDKEENPLFSIVSAPGSGTGSSMRNLIGDEIPENLLSLNSGHDAPPYFGSELCDYIGPINVSQYYQGQIYKTQYYYTTTSLNFTNRNINKNGTVIQFTYNVEATGNGETAYWTDLQGNTTSFNLNSSYTVQTDIQFMPINSSIIASHAIFSLRFIRENNIDFYKQIFILKQIKDQIEEEVNDT